jgi:hypothetical protein
MGQRPSKSNRSVVSSFGAPFQSLTEDERHNPATSYAIADMGRGSAVVVPDDVLELIFSFCHLSDIRALSLSCKRCRHVIHRREESSLWYALGGDLRTSVIERYDQFLSPLFLSNEVTSVFDLGRKDLVLSFVALSGERAVGKTSLIYRIFYSQFWKDLDDAPPITMTGVWQGFFRDKNYVQIFDYCCEFPAMHELCFTNDSGIVVYISDFGPRFDFDQFQNFLLRLQNTPERTKERPLEVLVVRTKSDENNRFPEKRNVLRYCEKNHIMFINCSAKEDRNCDSIMEAVVKNRKK